MEGVNEMSERKSVQRWPTGEDGLTDRERLFIAEVQVDWNYTAAAKRAGYSEHSAGDIGRELMAKPKIVDAIGANMKQRVAKAGISAKWVLHKLVAVHTAAEGMGGLGALDRRLKALELIGRHVDVDAFRQTAGMRALGDGPVREWDLARLDDGELEIFERLLAKISVEPTDDGSRQDGATGPSDADGTGADD